MEQLPIATARTSSAFAALPSTDTTASALPSPAPQHETHPHLHIATAPPQQSSGAHSTPASAATQQSRDHYHLPTTPSAYQTDSRSNNSPSIASRAASMSISSAHDSSVKATASPAARIPTMDYGGSEMDVDMDADPFSTLR